MDYLAFVHHFHKLPATPLYIVRYILNNQLLANYINRFHLQVAELQLDIRLLEIITSLYLNFQKYLFKCSFELFVKMELIYIIEPTSRRRRHWSYAYRFFFDVIYFFICDVASDVVPASWRPKNAWHYTSPLLAKNYVFVFACDAHKHKIVGFVAYATTKINSQSIFINQVYTSMLMQVLDFFIVCIVMRDVTGTYTNAITIYRRHLRYGKLT